MSKVELLNYTKIEPISIATAMPYNSKISNGLVTRVWNAGHKSIARHGMASFLIEGVSQSLLRQISRHPHINLTVKSTRYCDMNSADIYVPTNIIKDNDKYKEYQTDMAMAMQTYSKWKNYENDTNKEDIAKLFLPLASTTDLVLSGNYQALYEFLQLRNCTRTEQEFRQLSLKMSKILIDIMPEIFAGLGCRGDELEYCPETSGSCGKYPQKGEQI